MSKSKIQKILMCLLRWQIAGKLVNIKLHTRRSQRVVKGSRSICRCDCWRSNSTASPILWVLSCLKTDHSDFTFQSWIP